MSVRWNREGIQAVLRRYQGLLLVLAAGLALLLWPVGSTSEDTQSTEPAVWEDEQYVQALEQRLSDALSRMDGVGQATVVLTLDEGFRRELAGDERGEERETVVISSGTGHQETVEVQRSAPRLQGALVVCPGGGVAEVRLNIMRAVSALTGLSANQISICQGGNQG